MTSKSEIAISVGIIVLMFVVGIVIWIFQSSVERDVWNKCHPSHQLELWETMWSTTRIDNCEVPDDN